MNRLTPERRAAIVAALVEGNSIRATCRMTGAAKGTVLKLLVDIGAVCWAYQHQHLVNLPCERIQCDEIWSFSGAKQKNVPEDKIDDENYGDIWTWVGICADTKLVPSWWVGPRDTATARLFMRDLAHRLTKRVQLTTDGHQPYLEAIEGAFAGDIDYAMLIKIYGPEPDGEKRYSPSACLGTQDRIVQGNPDPAHISTSYVERQNLTLRMSMRRFTRLTNAFTRKVENLQYALALHYMNYNYRRIHQTLGVTPAMAAGVADHPWKLDEMIGLLTTYEARVESN